MKDWIGYLGSFFKFFGFILDFIIGRRNIQLLGRYVLNNPKIKGMGGKSKGLITEEVGSGILARWICKL